MNLENQAPGSNIAHIIMTHGFFVDIFAKLLNGDDTDCMPCGYCSISSVKISQSDEEGQSIEVLSDCDNKHVLSF